MCGSGSDGHGIDARGDFGDGPAAPGVAAECVARDVEKGLRECIWDARVGLASGWQRRHLLRKCFDQGHAERPDVSGGGQRRRCGFRSIVSIEFAGYFAGFADREESVAG